MRLLSSAFFFCLAIIFCFSSSAWGGDKRAMQGIISRVAPDAPSFEGGVLDLKSALKVGTVIYRFNLLNLGVNEDPRLLSRSIKVAILCECCNNGNAVEVVPSRDFEIKTDGGKSYKDIAPESAVKLSPKHSKKTYMIFCIPRDIAWKQLILINKAVPKFRLTLLTIKAP